MAILSKLQEQVAESSYEASSYDVFLSFRGEDTRLSFSDHLYRALINDNIRTFRDEEEVKTGEQLSPELTKAIKSSCAAIIVLSKDYASSKWCLDELVMILEQQEKTSDYVIVPIFYHVEPTHIRKKESSFGEAMAKHKRMIDEEKDEEKKIQCALKLELWKMALTKVANLKGKVAHARPETEFIEEIVKEINDRLGLHLRTKFPQLIGMETDICSIGYWLKDQSSPKVIDILTIWGMAGIGKTTLAEYVYKLHYREFERSSFIEGIGRKCAEQSGALLDLQKQLLGDVLKKSTIEVRDVYVGTAKIENALSNKQTFLVLDDIDNFEQLDVLIGTKGFHHGTKIIVTTKEGSLTEKCALLFRKTYPSKQTKHKLFGLSDAESLELLCWHAFGTNAPTEGYEQEAVKVAMYCDGHPLALKVLGSSLINEDVATWSYIFERFETKQVYTKIQKVLQISFNLLPSEDCQELFKHIACFFVGKDREVTETIMKECGIHTSYGITKLIDRCLLTIGYQNKLHMHQLIQEMGRDIVRQESPTKPWKRSRLWNYEESLNLLTEDKGTSKVVGLVLDMKMLEEDPLPSSSYVRKRKFEDVFNKKFISPSKELRTDALAKMDKLLLLQLNHVKLKGSYRNLPQGLKWLCIHGFRLKHIPSKLAMENLIVLDMSCSNLEQLWKKPVLLKSLKILNLSHCIKLVRVGGFSGLPSLERLILEGCVSLNYICESIGDECARLILVELSNCNKLRKLPKSIGKLKKVKILSISGCCAFDEFPIDMKNMESLQVLKAERIPKMVLHSLPILLVTLSLKDNNLSNESFPIDLSSMITLKELYLDNNPIDSLPTFVRSLRMLQVLSVSNCSLLKSVLSPPSTIKYLSIKECSSLMKITFHEEMLSLPYINYKDAESLNEISGIIKFQDLSQVDEKILSALGWSNLECVKGQELNIKVPNSWPVVKKLPVQMCYEFGIFSTYFNGKEVPSWLGGLKTSNGSSISFVIPSTPVNKRLQGFNISFVHTFMDRGKRSVLQIKIVNKTKNLTWEYWGVIFVTRKTDEDIVWLCHWMFGNNEFEDGDEATLEIDKYNLGRVMVKECVIVPVYSERSDMIEEDDPLAYYKSWKYRIGGDLSQLQLAPGYYSKVLHRNGTVSGLSKYEGLHLQFPNN